MNKCEVVEVLRRSLAEVDGMKFLLDYEDLIWRMSSNAQSVQALLEDMVDAEQRLWSALLPGCLESGQRRIFQDHLHEQQRYWKNRHRIHRTSRRIRDAVEP